MGKERSGDAESRWQKQQQGLLQWTEWSVGTQDKGPVHLKSTDEMETFSDIKGVVARWSEYFQKLLNVPGDIDHEALDNAAHYQDMPRWDSNHEMARTIAGLNDCKAPVEAGIDDSALVKRCIK